MRKPLLHGTPVVSFMQVSKLLISILGRRLYYQPLVFCFAFSPGEVPDTREALLNAFKRLDSDLSLEAQVGLKCRRSSKDSDAPETRGKRR